MRKVLILDRFHVDALALLQLQTDLQVLDRSLSAATDDELSTASALIIRSKNEISRAFLSRCPKLQVIVSTTAGFDHIDLAAAAAFGITVMHTPDAHTQSVAELTWALMLACARKMPTAHRQVKNADWNRAALEGSLLQKKTLGIVGLGRIGGRVADMAHAFQMQVVAFDPYQTAERFRALEVERVSWEECLKLSDVVSLHVPLTKETRHMVHRSCLEFTNRNQIIINTSRGPVINEEDLLMALEKQWIRGAGLDVFEREPLAKHSRLLQMEGVVLSPHIGALTDTAFRQAGLEAAEKLITFFQSGETSDTLPPKAEWWGATGGSFRAALV